MIDLKKFNADAAAIGNRIDALTTENASLQMADDKLTADNQMLREALRDAIKAVDIYSEGAVPDEVVKRLHFVLAATSYQALDNIKSPYEARIAELEDVLFPFAEWPTGGWDDNANPDVEYPKPTTNQMILNARRVFSCTPADSLKAYRRKVLLAAADGIDHLNIESPVEENGADRAAALLRQMAGGGKER